MHWFWVNDNLCPNDSDTDMIPEFIFGMCDPRKKFCKHFLICFDSYYGFWWWNEQRSNIYLLFFFINFLIRFFFFFFPPGFQDFSMLLKNSDTIHASDESSVCIYIFSVSFFFIKMVKSIKQGAWVTQLSKTSYSANLRRYNTSLRKSSHHIYVHNFF